MNPTRVLASTDVLLATSTSTTVCTRAYTRGIVRTVGSYAQEVRSRGKRGNRGHALKMRAGRERLAGRNRCRAWLVVAA
eukprot:COSAG02_NODE_39071_length_421_cov_1.024845_1_plen_78_part_01